ncbi:hypothetical protein MWK40_00025 [Escherichia coli]|nr:hypothetical protein [Escherichia coli]
MSWRVAPDLPRNLRHRLPTDVSAALCHALRQPRRSFPAHLRGDGMRAVINAAERWRWPHTLYSARQERLTLQRRVPHAGATSVSQAYQHVPDGSVISRSASACRVWLFTAGYAPVLTGIVIADSMTSPGMAKLASALKSRSAFRAIQPQPGVCCDWKGDHVRRHCDITCVSANSVAVIGQSSSPQRHYGDLQGAEAVAQTARHPPGITTLLRLIHIDGRYQRLPVPYRHNASPNENR